MAMAQAKRRRLPAADARLRILDAAEKRLIESGPEGLRLAELAQELVDELIVALDRAMGGTFREYLDGEARAVAERASVESGSGISPARNS